MVEPRGGLENINNVQGLITVLLTVRDERILVGHNDVDVLLQVEYIDGLPGSIVLGRPDVDPASIGVSNIVDCRKHASSINFCTTHYALDSRDVLKTEMVQTACDRVGSPQERLPGFE